MFRRPMTALLDKNDGCRERRMPDRRGKRPLPCEGSSATETVLIKAGAVRDDRLFGGNRQLFCSSSSNAASYRPSARVGWAWIVVAMSRAVAPRRNASAASATRSVACAPAI